MICRGSCAVSVLDIASPVSFRNDVLVGLRRPQKRLPCKYLYDERGSKLFDEICGLPEYYLTRTESRLVQRHRHEIADLFGARTLLIEFGSGTSTKTRRLLDCLDEPSGYVPVDLARTTLERTAAHLADEYPSLLVLPVCADFTQPLDLPPQDFPSGRRVVLFSGSTLGNLSPAGARSQLTLAAELCGPGGGLLLGVDMQKERGPIQRAYNDRGGVTAAFNLNLLRRMNRELGTNFRPERFSHYALFDAQHQRMEMHLVSRGRQEVTLGDEEFEFSSEETIHTESSYKFSPEGVAQLAESSGWRVVQSWTDSRQWFSLNYLEVA